MNSLLLALLVAAPLPSGTVLAADPATSSIRYTVVHKLHQVDAESRAVEAKALVKEDGTVQAMARIPVATFKSGDGNRDEHMIEALEAGKYPFVVVKGVGRLGPTRQLPVAPLTLDGELDFHGVKRPVSVPVTLVQLPDGAIRARGSFEVSLDAYGVERPALLFVKVDDACRIDFDLVLRGGR